jgi:heme-degrading monooxygenase HmoA
VPALPWTKREEIAPDRTYVAMASRLPLQHYRSIPGFLRYTMAIRKQLATAHGLIGYSLNAQPARKTFWTFSVWADRESLDAFAMSEPHRRITTRLGDRMGPTNFEFLSMTGSDLPLGWDEIARRV